MLSVERETVIVKKLKQQGRVRVNDLANELDVTKMTIRRDLNKLERQGVLRKVHGGAVLPNRLLREKPFEEKQALHTEEKRRLAQNALQLVHEGDTILLDAGTTTFELAARLHELPGVNVVTIDLHIALELCATEGNLFFIGGEIEKELGRSTGTKALEFLEAIHVDTVFLGISAISPDMMLGSHTFENAELKRTMLKSSSKKVLLADTTKFGVHAFAHVCPLSHIDILITNKHLTEQERAYLEAHHITPL